MQNPILARQLEECNKLAENWTAFLDLFNAAVKDEEYSTPQREQDFLAVKSQIAMYHETFIDALRQERRQTGQSVFGIVARCITIRHVNRMGQAETRKIQIEWHECDLLIHETINQLQQEIQRLSSINGFTHHFKRTSQRFFANLAGFFSSFLFKFVIALGVVWFIIVGVPALGLYDYDNFRRIKSIAPAYASWLNFKRVTWDNSTPFARLEDFRNERLSAKTPPSGFKYGEDQKSVEEIKTLFQQIPMSGEKTLTDGLSRALNSLSVDLRKLDNRGWKVDVFLFHFYETKDAEETAEVYNNYVNLEAKGQDTGFRMFSINNVLVVLGSSAPDWRHNAANHIFKQPLLVGN